MARVRRFAVALGQAYLVVLALVLVALVPLMVWHVFVGGARWALLRVLDNAVAAVLWPFTALDFFRTRGLYSPSLLHQGLVTLVVLVWMALGWSVFVSMCWRWNQRRQGPGLTPPAGR